MADRDSDIILVCRVIMKTASYEMKLRGNMFYSTADLIWYMHSLTRHVSHDGQKVRKYMDKRV